MKIIGNIIYLEMDAKEYKKRMQGIRTDIMIFVNKIEDAYIQSSEWIDYISIMNVDNEWSFMKKLKSISRIIFWNKQIGYLFEW